MSSLIADLAARGLAIADLLLMALLVVFLIEELVNLPRFRRKLRNAGPGDKTPLYLVAAGKLWLMAIAIVAAWSFEGRPFSDLGAVPPAAGWCASLVWGTVALIAAFFAYQLIGLLVSAAARARYRTQVARAGEGFRFMPDTAGEHGAFCLLGVTAGITEEIIFRGYLIWAFSQVVSLPVAALIALALFGVFHAYQGLGGLFAATFAGAVMTVLFLLSGSLLPVIVLHALIDVVNAQTSIVAKRDIGLGRAAPDPV